MEHSIKTMFSLIISFICVVLLTNMLAFYLKATKARSTMYSIVEYIEVYGNKTNDINNFAKESNVNVSVKSIETKNNYQRYEVTVSFVYRFMFLNYSKTTKYKGITRFVEY